MTKRNYSKTIKSIMLLLSIMLSTNIFAQEVAWEQIYKLPATNAFHIASNGNLILADYQYDFTGGIYFSEDKGQTWKKADVVDYAYNIFYENDEYIFAAGNACRVARSNDGGKTWELLSYKRAVEDALGEEADYSVAYALTMHDGKLFLGDFAGGGIIYSEDNGETWKQTDINALSYGEEDPKLGKRPVENIYSLASYNGELYAFGVYFVFRYLPETNSWETIRSDSNFMAVYTIYQGKLCTGRSVMNYSTEVPFIETLDENGVWSAIERPEGTDDNNIRAIYASGNDLFVGMQQSGLYYTNDGGENWSTLSNGIPYSSGTYFTPMFIRADEEYVYLAAYEPPFATTSNSGLYRLAKADLPKVTGIKNLGMGNNSATFNGSSLNFSNQAEQAAIYDLSGRPVSVLSSGNSINVDHLNPGTYIYRAKVNGQTISGKISKQ